MICLFKPFAHFSGSMIYEFCIYSGKMFFVFFIRYLCFNVSSHSVVCLFFLLMGFLMNRISVFFFVNSFFISNRKVDRIYYSVFSNNTEWYKIKSKIAVS